MKKFLLSLLLIVTANFLIAQTSIAAGNVYGTWTLAGSPYNVSGNIIIPSDSTLIIQPGVSVIFTGTYRFDVQGRMVAIGTITDTIIFTGTGFWRGIRFNGTSSTQDSSLFVFCKVQKSKYGYCSSCATDYLKGGAFMMEGFSKIRISNCRITQNEAYAAGGGIYCKNSAPIITNNTITNNDVVNGNGGGIYCSGASLDITNNLITNNSVFAGHLGGGIYCDSSSSNITGNIIRNNIAKKGGGIYCAFGNFIVDSNIISYNSVSDGNGAGIYCAANATITNNTIMHNLVPYNACYYCGGGSGIYCFGSAPQISNNTINSNTISSGYGSGMYLEFSYATISNNSIDSNLISAGGGVGIYSHGAAPLISNNTINNNTSATNGNGGGLLCASGTNLISNNDISNNSVTGEGGGIYCSNNDSANIINNTINNNNASYGGGIRNTSNSISISGNVISYDSAVAGHGGGIHTGNYYSPNIFNNTINNNYTSANGGGIYCDGFSASTITNNLISNNSANCGAGIHCFNDASTIIDNVIVNNTAFCCGSGVYTDYSDSKFYNCTIANNTTTTSNGGGLYATGSPGLPLIRNVVFWGNTAGSGIGNNVFSAINNTNFDDCDIQGGGFPGNNINLLPLFVSPSAGAGVNFNGLSANWTVQASSPCINTGDTTGLTLPLFDVAGNPRVVNQVDMGAYEWQIPTSVLNEKNYSTQIISYPNPFSASTILKATFPFNNATLILQNSLGQTVKEIENISGESVILYRDNLPSGIYFIRLTLENETIGICKLVIVD